MCGANANGDHNGTAGAQRIHTQTTRLADMLKSGSITHDVLPMSDDQLRHASTLLTILSALPIEWFSTQDIGWLLPCALILAHLCHLSINGQKGTELPLRRTSAELRHSLLVAALRLASTLAGIDGRITRRILRRAECKRLLKWTLLLPSASSKSLVFDGRRTCGVESHCAKLIYALTSAELTQAQRICKRQVATTANTDTDSQHASSKASRAMETLLSPHWTRWLHDLQELLWDDAVDTAQSHNTALRLLAAHLDALRDALPTQRSHRSPKERSAQLNLGVDTSLCKKVAEWLAFVRPVVKPSSTARPHGGKGSGIPIESQKLCPPFRFLEVFKASPDCAKRSFELETSRAICAIFQFSKAWLRCYLALTTHDPELIDTLEPPPFLRNVLSAAIETLSPSETQLASAMADTNSSSSDQAHFRADALSYIHSLSERPDVLFAALPLPERHAVVIVLMHCVQPLVESARLTPSGRVAGANYASTIGMLRRFLVAADDGGILFEWALERFLDTIHSSQALRELCRALLALGLLCSASAPLLVSHLISRRADIVGALVSAATRTGATHGPDGGSDLVQTCALRALTALTTNDQVRLASSDGAPILLAAGSPFATHLARTGSLASTSPSTANFNAAYFLLTALLRQRSRLVHSVATLLLAAIRGMFSALARTANREVRLNSMPPQEGVPCMDGTVECARNMRRLLELVASHKKVMSTHLVPDVALR